MECIGDAIDVNAQHLDNWLSLAAPLIILPPWIWLALRTRQCLEIISRRTIPYTKRTIWLTKTLALIVGAAGVAGAAATAGIPWFLALLPAGILVVFALRENVKEIVPPKPNQDESVIRSSWEQYRRLRRDYIRSCIWFGCAVVLLAFLLAVGDKMPNSLQGVLFILCAVALLASIAVMYAKQLRWVRWPCPRCGCAFRGMWWRPLLPTNCVYCGLPKENDATLVRANS